MIIYPRTIQSTLERFLFQGKVLIIYGARQTGKTTLIRIIQEKYPQEALYLNCDEPDIRAMLAEKTSTELQLLIKNKSLILIDEAQRVKNIGVTLKLLVDNIPNIQIIATGSSSFDLSNDISEPLTGRKYEFNLYPLSVQELLSNHSRLEIQRSLEFHLRYGMYPGVISSAEPTEVLLEMSKSYLYKDVLHYQTVKNPDLILKLLRALALQVGNEVSYKELGTLVGIDKITVARYIALLEQGYILFHLPPFSRNLRKEIGKMRKIYFWDMGIRNALINNFNALNMRQDVGSMWENFFISERVKMMHNQRRHPNLYFWRTYEGKEIDYLEENAGAFIGFECKWGKVKWQAPSIFNTTYPNSQITLVNQSNWLEFLI